MLKHKDTPIEVCPGGDGNHPAGSCRIDTAEGARQYFKERFARFVPAMRYMQVLKKFDMHGNEITDEPPEYKFYYDFPVGKSFYYRTPTDIKRARLRYKLCGIPVIGRLLAALIR